MLERCLWTDKSSCPAAPLSRCPPPPMSPSSAADTPAWRRPGPWRRAGTDVTLLEQHHLGWGASSRNGGFVLQGYKPEMEELARMVGPDRARRMFQLTLDAMQLLARLIAEEEIACDFTR